MSEEDRNYYKVYEIEDKGTYYDVYYNPKEQDAAKAYKKVATKTIATSTTNAANNNNNNNPQPAQPTALKLKQDATLDQKPASGVEARIARSRRRQLAEEA